MSRGKKMGRRISPFSKLKSIEETDLFIENWQNI